jgi:hypothetical protein
VPRMHLVARTEKHGRTQQPRTWAHASLREVSECRCGYMCAVWDTEVQVPRVVLVLTLRLPSPDTRGGRGFEKYHFSYILDALGVLDRAIRYAIICLRYKRRRAGQRTFGRVPSPGHWGHMLHTMKLCLDTYAYTRQHVATAHSPLAGVGAWAPFHRFRHQQIFRQC